MPSPMDLQQILEEVNECGGEFICKRNITWVQPLDLTKRAPPTFGGFTRVRATVSTQNSLENSLPQRIQTFAVQYRWQDETSRLITRRNGYQIPTAQAPPKALCVEMPNAPKIFETTYSKSIPSSVFAPPLAGHYQSFDKSIAERRPVKSRDVVTISLVDLAAVPAHPTIISITRPPSPIRPQHSSLQVPGPRSRPYRKAPDLTRHPRPTFKNDYRTFKASLPTPKTPFKPPLKTSPGIPDSARPQFTDSKPYSKQARISSSWSQDGTDLRVPQSSSSWGLNTTFGVPAVERATRPGAVLSYSMPGATECYGVLVTVSFFQMNRAQSFSHLRR
ncbi:hypothetical protein C8F04DRAFT_1303262 [Mycena alexandri]|uniref:Uncharacterized protein n=1 Tax=Mycena alexandri TaxID=1745969 RepID=A0AAD6SAF3_9AGAR|nr:hypothetical protein C8F04DRAFT_1303262 [Mycena alexandri]